MLDPRPYAPAEDEDGVVALYARARALDPTVPALDRERWRAIVGSACFRNGLDSRVIDDDDQLVGLLVSGWQEDSRAPGGLRVIRVLVDPAHRRRGIGTALLREAVAQAENEQAFGLQTDVGGEWRAGRAFAEAHGFEVLVRDLFLARDGSPPASSALPAGIALRAYAPGRDDEAWAQLANSTLVRDAVFRFESARSVARQARAPGFSLWIAEAVGAEMPIGFCHAELRGELGLVQSLGVRAPHEGRGVGAALLARTLSGLVAAGARRIELCTESDNLRAQRLYARHGFRLAREAFTYRRALAPAFESAARA
jgi:mycothiol synthase